MNHCLIGETFTWRLRLSAFVVLLASLLVVMQPARADTYQVTNTNNSGPGSLRQAMTDAYNHPGPDIVTFLATTDGTPIVLSGAPGDDANITGDLDILDGGNLTIQGNGVENTIIDGGGFHRVFHVCPGGGCGNSVTLDGLTIQNGSVANGGGVYVGGSVIMLSNSLVRANRALLGAGIYAGAGTATIDASSVISNASYSDGGGIYNLATLNLQNGTVIGGAGVSNTATEDGGGIYNGSGGSATLDDSTIISNTAEHSGGGIYNSATLTVQNGSDIRSNAAKVDAGGIYNGPSGVTTVDKSSILYNTASEWGGGILSYGTIAVRNDSTVSANTAKVDGGGIVIGNGTGMVDGSVVSANTATSRGGGIWSVGELTIQNSSTIGGVGVGNTAGLGGGIYTLGSLGTTTVTGSRILNNTATTTNNGGGILSVRVLPGATSVTGSCIVGNSANSFHNNQPAQQTATGNWWGASGGPNTPGADTYGGNVDVSGHLTAPILGCAPDLQMSKANDTGGQTTAGTPFHWTLSVVNSGLISATFDALDTMLVDQLPAIGPTYGQPLPGNFRNVANSANIGCSIVGSVLTCTAAGGDVTLGPGTGGFDVTFSVSQDTPATLTNPSGICRIDPDGNIVESNESDNDCQADTVNVVVSKISVYLPMVRR